MRRNTFVALAILCVGLSGCATTGDWWPFRGGGAKSAGGTYKGVKEDWGMQAANMQPPKDLEDTSSTFGW